MQELNHQELQLVNGGKYSGVLPAIGIATSAAGFGLWCLGENLNSNPLKIISVVTGFLGVILHFPEVVLEFYSNI